MSASKSTSKNSWKIKPVSSEGCIPPTDPLTAADRISSIQTKLGELREALSYVLLPESSTECSGTDGTPTSSLHLWLGSIDSQIKELLNRIQV